MELLHEYLSYSKASRPYFMSTLSPESQGVVHNLYEHLARLHATFEILSSEEKAKKMKELFPSERKSLVLYQVMVAETFTMPSTSMITPTGGRRGRGLKPMNSEPTMKGPGKGSGGAAGGSSLRVDTSSPQKKNAGTVQNMMAMSTGRMVSTPASIKRSGLLEDSPDGSSPIERSREQETGDLALGSLDMEQTSFGSSESPNGLRRMHTMIPKRSSV